MDQTAKRKPFFNLAKCTMFVLCTMYCTMFVLSTVLCSYYVLYYVLNMFVLCSYHVHCTVSVVDSTVSTLQWVISEISEKSDGADITEFWHEISEIWL